MAKTKAEGVPREKKKKGATVDPKNVATIQRKKTCCLNAEGRRAVKKSSSSRIQGK